ncbi:MAG: hypothetical protein ACFCUV_11215, partial [Rivularia sp. (in: cyanobacteria)]
MKFLLSGVIVTLGLLPLSVQAQPRSLDNQVARMVEALRLAAPKTGSVNDGYYSEWQVKPATLKSWSKFCLKKEVSPTEFENNPQLARQIISCITQRE